MATNNPNDGWYDEDQYWRENFRTRPYASSADQEYEDYEPGYRYGYDAANRYQNRSWEDVESDLSQDWSTYDRRGTSTWEQMKGAVRDAWDRMTGNRSVGAR